MTLPLSVAVPILRRTAAHLHPPGINEGHLAVLAERTGPGPKRCSSPAVPVFGLHLPDGMERPETYLHDCETSKAWGGRSIFNFHLSALDDPLYIKKEGYNFLNKLVIVIQVFRSLYSNQCFSWLSVNEVQNFVSCSLIPRPTARQFAQPSQNVYELYQGAFVFYRLQHYWSTC